MTAETLFAVTGEAHWAIFVLLNPSFHLYCVVLFFTVHTSSMMLTVTPWRANKEMNVTRLLSLTLVVVLFAITSSHAINNTGTEDSIKASGGYSPAKDLKMMQGHWKVKFVILPSLGNDGTLPEVLGFTETGSEIEIKSNAILCEGKTVATLANELSLPQQEKELGFQRWHLMLLALPTGKGVLCSYNIVGNKMEIAYTHKCFCHRGSGHIVAFERITK